MDWITDSIAIGNIKDAENISPDVDAVLCLKGGCFCKNINDVDVEHIPLKDGTGNDPTRFYDAVEFIDDIVSSGEKILVHCQAGRSRSVVVVALYLMVKNHLTRDEAIRTIAAKREIYLSTGIGDVLQRVIL